MHYNRYVLDVVWGCKGTFLLKCVLIFDILPLLIVIGHDLPRDEIAHQKGFILTLWKCHPKSISCIKAEMKQFTFAVRETMELTFCSS